jgi:hypothetical protein
MGVGVAKWMLVLLEVVASTFERVFERVFD